MNRTHQRGSLKADVLIALVAAMGSGLVLIPLSVNPFWPLFVGTLVLFVLRNWRGPRDVSNSLRAVGVFLGGTLVTFVVLNALGFAVNRIVKAPDEGPGTLLSYLSFLASPIVGVVLSARVMRRRSMLSVPPETTER